MRKVNTFLIVAALPLFIAAQAYAQFTTGNVVTLQVGNGVQTLSNLGNSLFLKEFSPLGAPGISVTIPDNGATALLNSGAATSEGHISRSVDGSAILVPGYNTSVPYSSSLPATTSAAVPRGIGKVDGFGNYTLPVTSTSFFSGGNIRSAAGNGPTNYWATGSNTGNCYFGTGAPATISSTVTNERALQIYNGNLMFSSASGTVGIYQITGTPTSGANVAALVLALPGGSPYGFAIDAGSTTLYVADDRVFSNTSTQAGGIEKFTWNGSAWVFQYTLQCGATTSGARGLIVDFSGANPILYATTTEATANRLIKITDTGANSGASALLLSTAPAATAYRGVAFSPCGAGSIGSITSNSPVCTGTTLNLSVTTLGSPAFTYSWSGPNGFTSSLQNPSISSVTGAAAGNYTVTVTNACGSSTQSTSVTVNTSPTSTPGASVTISCNGGSNGSAAVTASGGTPGYTYSWSPSGGTAASASGLSANNYTCTVTDANGCTATSSFAITQPAVLSAGISSANVLCNGGSNGSATVTASGGTTSYSYAWTPSGGTAATASGLSNGNYTCTITDANGCTTTASVAITQPSALSASSSQTNVSCNGGSNGSATVTASGGTTAYTYSWAPSGGTAATASGLSNGNYTCTITDANGCTTTASFNITQPSALSASSSQTNVSCNGGSNGSATVNASGGVPAYTYAWTPSGGTAATASSLSNGTYTCTITDANGCTITASFNITQPALLTATGSQTNVSCNLGSNGSATVTASGGTPVYTYSWAPSGGTAATASSLSSGTYTCTITDGNGCTTTASFNITQPSHLSTTSVQTNITCNGGNNGSATVTPSGGTPGYTYSWAPSGGTGATASSLTAGTYTCTVTDVNGCTASSIITLTQPSVLSAAVASQTDVLCNGAGTGAATVTASGGIPGYTYSWAPSGGTAATASSLTAGTYTCTVTDVNGCTTTSSVTITQPSSPLAASTSQVDIPCNGGNTGSASVAVSGGTPGYTYAWTPSGGTAPTESALTIGTYTCLITDANGCTLTETFNIIQPSSMVATPTQTDVNCNGNTNGTASVSVSGGTPGYTYSWSPAGGTGSSASALAAGTYTCTITDASGCALLQTVTITEPAAITATNSQADVSCNAGNNGSATVTVSGGTPGYTYAWTPSGGSGSTANALVAGNYTCTITDVNGCSTSSSFIITEPAALAVTASQTDLTCSGSNNGSATVNVSGGTPGYTYTWLPSGGNAATATALSAGNYTCTVTDQNGCATSSSFVITAPAAIAAVPSQTNISCNGGNTGNATVTVSGGTSPYTYNWTPSGGTAATATALAAGTYTCTVTDANGCTLQQTFTITQAAALTATAASSAVCGASSGSATATVSGGTSPYTYSWAPSGGTAATSSGLASGTYTCTITDAAGCTQTVTVNVVANPLPTATVSPDVTISIGTSTTLSAGGGTTYNWSPVTGLSCTNCPDPLATPVQTTTYCVLVTDANGCSDTACTTVTVDIDCPEIFVPNVFSPNNDNQNDLLCIYGKQCIETLHFSIFDRWGENVFDTFLPDDCWDGTYKGKPLDPGVFVYVLDVKTYDGKDIRKKGNITILK